MAEASCGPSSSLQSFQKHTAVDRTLQQDRLATREPSSHGFRSSSNKLKGILDAEFEAFRAGIPLDNAPEHQSLGPYGPINPAPELVSPPAPDWASDFQSLHLNHVPAHSVSKSLIEEQEGLQHDLIGKWDGQPAQTDIPIRSRYVLPNGLPGFSHQLYQPLSLGAHQAPTRQPYEDLLDVEALDRAFDAVHAELDQSEEQLRAEMAEYGQISSLSNERSIRQSLLNGKAHTKPIGSDQIPKTNSQEKQGRSEKDEHDELARTAGELLDKVAHHEDRKFQDSNFLFLMRQLRDREVQVKGDMIVGVPQPLHPGGKFYPEGRDGQLDVQADQSI